MYPTTAEILWRCLQNRSGARGILEVAYAGRAGREVGVIDYSDFERVDIRVGRIVRVDAFPEARKPAYRLQIDFGSLGIKRSSAQLTAHYQPADLVGLLVLAVVNFPPRQIGPYLSEVLTLGVPDDARGVVLVVPDKDVPIGGRLF